MRSSLLVFLLTFMLAISVNGQDKNTTRNTTVEVAPQTTSVSDNNGNMNLLAYGSRWFGQNAAATSFFNKGFLTSAATHTNFGAGSTNLYGAMEFDNTGKLYVIAVAAGSPLQTLDTVTGALTLVAPISGVTGQILGMSFNTVTNTMYITSIDGTASDKLYTINLSTGAGTLVGGTNFNMFDIAINSTGQCYGISVTDNLISIDLATGAGTQIGPIGFDANFIQGISFDRGTDSLWYAAYNQTAGAGQLRKVNLTTGATTLVGTFNPAAEVCGFCIPSVSGPPPTGDTVLVLVHDSTGTASVKRDADRDTLRRNLSQLVRNYKIQQFDTNTTFSDLASYKTIIVQETSFDVAARRYLGATARSQIKAWLNSGTAGNKKSLLTIGADQGYNYSRTGSGGRDLEWAETFGKFVYRVDNATSGAVGDATQGVGIDVGNVRVMSATPPGGGYYPDGCGIIAGGSTILYKYQDGGTTDTLAAIGNNQTGYVIANVFQDPRYFTTDFKAVLSASIGWLKANGGVITSAESNNNVVNVVPDNYRLSQNYPNPFNPSTKINFTIPKSGMVSLKIFDMLGREIKSLVNEFRTAGSHEVTFNGSDLSSGVYYYRLESGSFTDTKKMSLVK